MEPWDKNALGVREIKCFAAVWPRASYLTPKALEYQNKVSDFQLSSMQFEISVATSQGSEDQWGGWKLQGCISQGLVFNLISAHILSYLCSRDPSDSIVWEAKRFCSMKN